MLFLYFFRVVLDILAWLAYTSLKPAFINLYKHRGLLLIIAALVLMFTLIYNAAFVVHIAQLFLTQPITLLYKAVYSTTSACIDIFKNIDSLLFL